MKSWLWPALCALTGLALFALAWSMPAHLRAVNLEVLRAAGAKTPGLVQHGQNLLAEQHPEAAQVLLDAAQKSGLAGAAAALDQAIRSYRPTAQSSLSASLMPTPSRYSAAETIIRTEIRTKGLQVLASSKVPSTRELLRTRQLTETVLLPSSGSSSGQPFDAAVILQALLLEEGHVTGSFSNEVYQLAAGAAQGGDSQIYEQMLLDTLSLSQRLTWDQLQVFMRKISGVENLRLLAAVARSSESNFPVIYATVELTGQPGKVADYLVAHTETGLHDLRRALFYGEGGARELLKRNLRLYVSEGNWGRMWGDFAWRSPEAALILKWFFFLGSGFLLALGVHYVLPVRAPAPVRGIHYARELLFASGFLVLMVLINEPYIAKEHQKADFSFKLRLPAVGTAVKASMAAQPKSFMDKSLLTLMFFFVVQSLIYVACLVKLAEVKRQRLAPQLKLKLLENEDHLFDAGLYLGFVGTIISLILVSLGVIQQSLMAAYSSTSFGIIFVSVFKIFNLRPYKRKLLLETEPPTSGPVAVRSASNAA